MEVRAERRLARGSWLPTAPKGPTPSQRARYVRELVGSILDRTCPVLLSRDEAIAALDLGPGTFDRWIRDGRLEDMVVVGERQLFQAAELREIILGAGV